MVLSASLLLRSLPTERVLTVDLGDPEGVRRVTVTWCRTDMPEDRSGFSQSFGGDVPRRIEHHVSLRDGEHRMEVRVERRAGDASSESVVEHWVDVRSDQLLLHGPARAESTQNGVSGPEGDAR
jgi:hypothetical protein